MEDAQQLANDGSGFIARVQDTWSSFTELIGKLPGISGSLEDIIGALIVMGVTAVGGFIVYSLVSG